MDVICFSHLRWNFVYQRPQHILSRLAKHYRVFCMEEPVFHEGTSYLDTALSTEGVWIVVPHLQSGLDESATIKEQQRLLQELLVNSKITEYILWYYTPMALSFSDNLSPVLTIYDCMDELSAFKNAPAALRDKEAELMRKADLVFTGGYSLYEAKKGSHKSIYAFPSSIDKKHFLKARSLDMDMPDQFGIARPRIGFFGVIDERMDLSLLEKMASLKPGWNFILIGPVVKIDPATLPQLSNIYYLGSKKYDELPDYLGGWNVAMMPFALNESTRFISPTKTPEYLAGGVPVVSTAINDVVKPYGDEGLVYIAHSAEEFVESIQAAIDIKDKEIWLAKVDTFLRDNSWDETVKAMIEHINDKLQLKNNSLKNTNAYV